MTQPLRILHVVPSYMPAVRYGGPIYSVHGLAKATVALGHQVDVFTTNADGPDRLAVPTDRWVDLDGVRVHYFPLGWPARLFRAPMMADAARKQLSHYDIVHIHALFLWPIMRMARLCRRAGVPYIISPRGMLVRELFARRSAAIKSVWMRVFDRATLEQASAIHWTATREQEDAAAFGYDLPGGMVIPNGVDASVDAATASDRPPELSDWGEAPFLLSLGRINWKKNLPELVRAIAGVPDVRLVIAGNDEDGDIAQLRAAIAQTGTADRVLVIDRAVVGGEKSWLYAHCDAFILPSISENFGNVAVEAMAAGRPVIATTACGVAAVIDAAAAGVTTGSDAASLRQAIATLLADRSAMQAMGARGRDYVQQKLSWESVARQMVEAYEAVIGCRHAR